MYRWWLIVSRATIVFLTIFPMWLGYAILFVRQERFGAKIPAERWKTLHARFAPRFYRLAVRMRGGLIKVGQIISTRADILPVEWTSTLSGLQDRVDPLPWGELLPHVTLAYGRDPKSLFLEIDEHATAAASFGQVHRAITHDGKKVALKIRYPDVDTKLSIDLSVMRFFLPLFGIFVPQMNLRPIQEEISRALTTELDYDQEARFTEIVHANFGGVLETDAGRIHIPAVVRDLTRPSVICTTWFEGKKIIDPTLLNDPRMDRRALLELVIEAWVKQMYVDGVFQSDPHPGNLLARVAADGKPELCVVDFGQVKILTKAFHQKLLASVMAFVTRNIDGFVQSLVDLGLFKEKDAEQMRPTVEKILERYASMSPDEITKMDFTWLRTEVLGKIAELRGIVVPQDLVLYGRTFALLAGLTRQVDPTVDAFALARPHVMRAMLSGGPPEAPAS
jgi:predicted unusual protein kinase regulating ubiquinone biosynthesis (AarF/ABC1/UbiB family)